MEAGIADPPAAAQAFVLAHWIHCRHRTLRMVPLPVWAGWSALCQPDDPAALPRLCGDVAARLAPDGASWPVVFLHLVTESARAGSRRLDGLRAAAEAGQALAKDVNAGSRLPAVLAQMLRQPAVAAPALARSLTITPQAALRLLARLQATGLVREVTGRTRFQGFALKKVFRPVQRVWLLFPVNHHFRVHHGYHLRSERGFPPPRQVTPHGHVCLALER